MKPAFADNNVAVVMCASNYYAPYTSVVVQSILDCKSDDHNYDLIVLSKDMTQLNKDTMCSMVAGEPNVSLRFVDMSEHVKRLSVSLLAHFTIESYFRIFIPYVLPEHERILYCDCDLVWLRDPAELFRTDLEGNMFGAVVDPIYIYNQKTYDDYWAERNEKELEMPPDALYTNTGIMVWDLPSFREMFSLEYVLRVACDKQFLFCDQDVLNALCGGQVFYLDPHWNVLADSMGRGSQLQQLLGAGNEYEIAREQPGVFHWADKMKPWNIEAVDRGFLFWRFARKSPFYEHIFYRISRDLYNWHLSQRGFNVGIGGLV